MAVKNYKKILISAVLIIFLGSVLFLIIGCRQKKTIPNEAGIPDKMQGEPQGTSEKKNVASDNEGDVVIQTNIKLKHATIAFTFDDGYESDYALAYPILKKYGIKGTSYIIANYPDHNVKDTLTWDQIKEMAASGWDFGGHTYMHSNLTKFTPEQIRQSMEEGNASFKKNGLKVPDVFAYPYGKFNQQVIDNIKLYCKQARLDFYQDDPVDLQNLDTYQIQSVSADMQKRKRLLSREKVVDKACENNALVVFRTHCMYRKTINDMGKWPVQTDSRLFEELVDYCVKKGCKFVTMDEFLKMYS